MAQKSILEQALLQVQTLEEAVKANAKGILASTMKQELNDLLKEQEDEKDPEEVEKDVDGITPDDEETSDNEPVDNGNEDLPLPVDDENDTEEDSGLDLPAEDEEDDEVLDMTDASEEEVLKVFKAMKPEDGIIVKKEGNTVEFSDEGNDYIIKLDDEDLGGDDTGEMPDELAEQIDETGDDEIVYEIELDDDESFDFDVKEEVSLSDGKPFDQKAKKRETKESVTVHKTHTLQDGKPFDKTSPQKGVKKLQANEESFVNDAKRPGTGVPGSSNPQTKEPGRGQVKTSDGRPGTGVKDMDTPKKYDNLGAGKSQTNDPTRQGTALKGVSKPVTKEPKEQKECDECGDKDVKEIEATEAARTKGNKHGLRAAEPRTGLPSKHVHHAGAQTIHNAADLYEQVKTLKKQNDEYKQALVLFKDKLNEVAVFNANLAYATRLFTEHSTTRQEKLDILKRFDTISVLSESKQLYSTIKAELDNKKPFSETAVEKITSTPSSSSVEMLSESKAYENPQFKRMKELMKKINQ